MRAINRRLRKLEDKVARRPSERDFRLVNLLRKRRRRRLEAAGQPFDDTPPESSRLGKSNFQADS